MKRKIKVSIIVVSYKKHQELFACLKSIYQYKLKSSFEIIVVDNARSKELAKKLTRKYPKVIYLQSPINLGYGAGNNLGASQAKGEYLLILNPDTRFIDCSMNKLIDFLDQNKKAVVVGPNLVHKSGIVFSQLGSRSLTPIRAIFALSILNKIFPNNPISKSYHLYDTNISVLRQVDVVAGSGLLIRRKNFFGIGGFDEKFFLYFEESDLAKRLKEKYRTAKLFINPDAQLRHDWSPGDPGTSQSRRIFQQSRFYYFKKHYGLPIALVVEFVCRLNKYQLLAISVIIAIGCLILAL